MELLPVAFSDCGRTNPCCTTGTTVTCPTLCPTDGIYDTLAQLKAAPASVFPLNVPKIFYLRGLNAIYDQAYRIYVSDPSSSAVPDDYSVVQATNFSGRLLLLFG